MNTVFKLRPYICEEVPSLEGDEAKALHKKKLLGIERKRLLLSGDHLSILGFTFGADSISEEVSGFFALMVSLRKNTVFIVSCV